MGLTPLNYTNFSTEHKMPQQQNILKRKRSFKRRRFMENIAGVSLAIIFLMTQNFCKTQAVPAMGSGYLRLSEHVASQQQEKQQQLLWHQRYIRDVGASLSASLQQQKQNLKDLLQQSSSTEVSLEQPQGQCLLDGEYVPETTVFCEKQVGCRAIQKTGHCCPDYKCDCQKDGKTYLNGDKLVDPETPCKVCYCQGGEILCSSVTCFHRDDCSPKYIAGVCCPEYDNCPVSTSESTNNKTLSTTTTTLRPEIYQAENNPKITIKEITKPIEIRITNDNKAIPIQQMLKPSTTTSTTLTTTTASTTTKTTISTTAPAIIAAISTTPSNLHNDAIKTKPTTTNADHNQQRLAESFETASADNNRDNKIIKSPAKGVINSGDILKLSASVAYPSTVLVSSGGKMISTHAPLDASVEVDDPVPALSVFSTQGLPEDPSKVNIKREYFITTEGALSGAAVFDGFGSGEYSNSELIFSSSAQGQHGYNTPLQQSSAELDPDTAGSDNIYHIILTTDGPRLTSTSENYLALKGISTTEGLPFDDLTASSNNPVESSNILDAGKNKPNAEEPLKTDHHSTRPSPELAIHQHLDDDESTLQLESNPAYPSLPEDDFSLRDNNFQINDSDDIQDEPRSIGGSHSISSSMDSVKSTKHLDDHTYGSGSGSDMVIDELALMPASSAEGSGEPTLAQSLENSNKNKSMEVIQLLYSGEDSSEETRIANATDFNLEKRPQSDSKEEDSSSESSVQQIDTGDFGSGSGEMKLAQQQKEREPTTARPDKKLTELDIDELHDASGNGPEDDPKLDVESLKLDEASDNSPASSATSAKNNILSVKVQPAQEKQLHEGLH